MQCIGLSFRLYNQLEQQQLIYVIQWSISLVMSRADPSAASTEILFGKALNYWQSNWATMSIVRGPWSVCDLLDGRFSMNSRNELHEVCAYAQMTSIFHNQIKLC